MTARFAEQWPTVVRFALFCGLVGPAIGVVVVVVSLYILRLAELGHVPSGWEPGNLLWLLLFYPLALIYAGPGGALFGALGTWLLMRQRAAGKTPRALRVLSIAYGVVLGGLVMPGYFVLISPLLHGFLRFQLRSTADWLLAVLLGSLVGAILGVVIAGRLANSGHPGTPCRRSSSSIQGRDPH